MQVGEKGGESQKRDELTPKVVSFRDRLLTCKGVPDDLLGKKLAILDWVDGNRLAPRVVFDTSIIQEFAQP